MGQVLTQSTGLPLFPKVSPSRETVLALDPGKTTGYCLGLQLFEKDKLYLAPDEGKFTLQDIDAMFYNLGEYPRGRLHVVYEDFEYRNYARMNLDLTPVKVQSIIELYKERWEPFVQFYKQKASQGKGFYTDDVLRREGVYKVGRAHGRDATRHLLQWATFGAGAQYITISAVDLELVELDWLLDNHYNGMRLLA